MGVRSLGYLRLESTDVPAWKVFGGDFLGMMEVAGADPESLVLPHRSLSGRAWSSSPAPRTR